MDIININDSIIEKEKQLEKLQNDIANLKKQEEQQILEKNTTIFLNSIYNIKLIEYDSIYLNSNTKTIPIIDKFYSKDYKKYLIIKNMYACKLYNKNKWISLVIKKIDIDINWIPSNITMSYLKSERRKYVYKNSLKNYEDEKGFELINAILSISKDDYLNKKQIPFNLPIQFQAQRSHNRTGYGSEYYCGDLVYQGTLYGETTNFTIIGILIEDSF